MRILSITAQKPNSTGSGVYLTKLVEQWALAGHQQAVVFGAYPSDQICFPRSVDRSPVLFDSPMLPFHITGMSDAMPYPSTRYRDMDQAMTAAFCTAFQQAVGQAVQRLEPQLIVCHHLYLLTALVRSWFPDRRVLGLCHGSDLRQLEAVELERPFILEQIGKLDGILALHQAQKADIMRIFSCQPQQVRVVGAGYDSSIFYPDPDPASACRQQQIVFAGKLSRKKGVPCLLRALEELPHTADIQVVLAGGHGAEEDFAQIQDLARRSPFSVELPGLLSQQELASLFRRSQIFVLPSLSEGLPLVALEAMACGCQVICTDLPGIAQWYDENVPGHQILFVPPPDGEDDQALAGFEHRLAGALAYALERPAKQPVDLSHISWQGVAQSILER